jgi:hypothetical protein
VTVLRSAAPILLLVIAIGACDGSRALPSSGLPSAATSSAPSPDASPAASVPTASLTPVPGGASPSPSPTDPPTTATEWGTIWDVLPGWYPVPHTAEPAIVGSGPATATFTVPAAPDGTAASMQAALEGAGYSTLAMSGPLEDGSIVIDSAGDGACRLQTTFAPAGDATLMTVLVGAACPFR